MSTFDIIQIVIDILSLIATVFVSFSIYLLQKKHEKELQEKQEKQHQKKIENEANRFLIDNESEHDYLPLCIIATNLHRHKKHTRKIYTDFCRCSEEVQKAILEQAGFKLPIISESKWFAIALQQLRDDIKKYNLGTDYLYDGGKYLYKNYSSYRKNRYYQNTERVFEPIYKPNNTEIIFNGSEKLILERYIEEYFDYVLDNYPDKKLNSNKTPLPPVDYVIKYFETFGKNSEEEFCYWIMEFVYDTIIIIHNKNHLYQTDFLLNNLTDAQSETIEDKYYDTLFWLYFTYIYKYEYDSEYKLTTL